MDKSLFSFPIRVRYAEVDSQGIVFNANYLNYFDILIGEYFREKVGGYTSFLREQGLDFHVIRSLIEYRNPASYEDVILFSLSGSYKGPKIFWKIKGRIADQTICEAELDYIAVGSTSRKITSLSPLQADLLGLRIDGKEPS
jgi:acyl-CoA thioester hydrolase